MPDQIFAATNTPPAQFLPTFRRAALQWLPALARSLVLLGLADVPVRAAPVDGRELESNMQVRYTQEQRTATDLGDVLRHGTWHGRVRAHAFVWDWANEKTSGTQQTRDHEAFAVGGSLVLRSARLHGWSGTIGLYTSEPLHRINTDPEVARTNFGRAGKDTYRTLPDGSERPLRTIAEAFIDYTRGPVTARAGRQIIDSLLLASNDTKMIPNTFEASRVQLGTARDGRAGIAVVRRQKLRDHAGFHSVLAYAKPSGNDDSGVHRGLTAENLERWGKDDTPPLLLATAERRLGHGLAFTAEAVSLPGLFATAVVDASWETKVNGMTVRPGVRYLRQFDRGAGAVGGAALSGAFSCERTPGQSEPDPWLLGAYQDPTDANASLWAARLGVARGRLQVLVATSFIRDAADIIAPWRGFPTGGFTRAIAQVDWLAGSRNHAARLAYDFGAGRALASLQVALGQEWLDYDDAKVAAGSVLLTDRRVSTLDVTAAPRALPRMTCKLRLAHVDADARPLPFAEQDYESYQEFRFELNRLF